MGSAAPLVQPAEPGHTVPGAAPSAKFTKANDPPPPDRAACTPSRAGESGRPVSQAANSTMQPRAIKRFINRPLRVWWRVVGQVSHLRVAQQRPSPLLHNRNDSVDG